MANRIIPFGYMISDAEIKVIEREAEVIKKIFCLYIQGMSLKIISERLNLTPISYADGRQWNKNMVKRILENPKYTGENEYPAIIPAETARMALRIKENKCIKTESLDKCRNDAYHDKIRCTECGGKMIKLYCGSDERKRVYWKCGNKDCVGNRHVINEKNLNKAISDTLNQIADNPNIIKVDIEKVIENDEKILSAENALEITMCNENADSTEVIEKMLELASAKFDGCKNGDSSMVTKKIESYMAIYSHTEEIDGNIIREIVKEIRISPYKTITLELMNGKEIVINKVSKWRREKEAL